MSIEEVIEEIAERTAEQVYAKHSLQEPIAANQPGPEVDELRRRLAIVNAKEFITIREAALLLSCSDGHLRNLIKKAFQNKTKRPVPYRDLDGVVVFPRVALLRWSEGISEEPGIRLVGSRKSN